MKIDRTLRPAQYTVTLSEREYGAIAASLQTAAADRSRRNYEYEHHYGLRLTAMAALSAKFSAAQKGTAKKTSSASAAVRRKKPVRTSARRKAKG